MKQLTDIFGNPVAIALPSVYVAEHDYSSNKLNLCTSLHNIPLVSLKPTQDAFQALSEHFPVKFECGEEETGRQMVYTHVEFILAITPMTEDGSFYCCLADFRTNSQPILYQFIRQEKALELMRLLTNDNSAPVPVPKGKKPRTRKSNNERKES